MILNNLFSRLASYASNYNYCPKTLILSSKEYYDLILELGVNPETKYIDFAGPMGVTRIVSEDKRMKTVAEMSIEELTQALIDKKKEILEARSIRAKDIFIEAQKLMVQLENLKDEHRKVCIRAEECPYYALNDYMHACDFCSHKLGDVYTKNPIKVYKDTFYEP